ncbi:atrial natriuretic peptide receptor 1 [Lingula anatina]|uniref:Guanylate cyclase n=1 Tax=Lingula anatina TaxID=7574 RepID=A0A1S3ILY7_LINAN|nr:atrial natriuretic peptide receptor 1 [Lingula anatina]|eukprot:XP_013398539.1 atrial natriuretic peptide receptor 1 [Lingula anatina]
MDTIPKRYCLLYQVTLVLFVLEMIVPARCWHNLDNGEFHCWPEHASDDRPETYNECPGITLRWIDPPPDSVRAQKHFNVTYELLVDTIFYEWAEDRQIFDAITNGTKDKRKGQTAKQWCVHTKCPSPSQASKENCCVNHVNVHSCPLHLTPRICGPWVSPNGTIFTHSEVMVGNVTQGNWTSLIRGLFEVGQTELLAHFKLGNMHIALHKSVKVLPSTVCGDEVCEAGEENCQVCPHDCGPCPLPRWQIGLMVTAGVVVLITVATIFGYFHWKQQKLLWDESWIISYGDVLADTTYNGLLGSEWSLAASSASSVSQFNADVGEKNNFAATARVKQIFTQTGIFKNRLVSIKRIEKRYFSLTKVIRLEVSQVRQLDHVNLVKFIGGCVEIPTVAIITEYCPKGGLNDVLQNDEIPLTWAFRFSFIHDIARGLHFLHYNKITHGRLKSPNCVIDDRWTVKISDFGLATYREDVEEDKYRSKACRVYRAPELTHLPAAQPTPEADVYAFAIILVEIATRNGPYGEEDIDDLPDHWKPSLPDLQSSGKTSKEYSCPCGDQYIQLIKRCWSDNPFDRPNFEQIKRQIHKINPNKQSPVDMMMTMMEKYSKHLEVMVAERTQDLMAEKQKTDRLLYSMLPKSVADALRLGKPVQAESFESCTIFFSDIVGFTELAGHSTPLEVVTLLNKLYTCFDEIIDRYSVYKVETIGDAYMVVSGVPIRNANHHCKEIANLAIDLVKESEMYVIPHKPYESLRIRVGLHSGPVCAGVVGLKMPRYCLFGDTVNTASRMESTGEAGKIHISDTTYQLLQEYQGFCCQSRGTIPIKGKGDMKTWWLATFPANRLEEVKANILRNDSINEILGCKRKKKKKMKRSRNIYSNCPDLRNTADSALGQKPTQDHCQMDFTIC